jgi:hypothetical protein
MGYTNLPPTFFDQIKSLESRITKLENNARFAKIYAAATGSLSVPGGTNTVTSAQVVINPSPFTVTPYVFVTAATTVPGTAVLGVSGAGSTVDATNGQQYQTTITCYVDRVNATATTVRWLAIQMRTSSADSGY